MDRLHKYFGGHVLSEYLLISELDPAILNESYLSAKGSPMTAGTISYFIVLDGQLEVTIDKKVVVCGKETNNFIQVSPFNLLYKAKTCNDFRGYLLSITKKFMDENLKGKRLFPPEIMQDFQLNPAITFPLPIIHQLAGILKELKYKITDSAHLFRDEMVCFKTLEFIFEFAAVLIKDKQHSPEVVFSRPDLIFKNFLRLVIKNCRNHREVSYYAEQLCITPQYLNKIVQGKVGKSASGLIADFLITEAVVLLQQPDLNIREISETLNFSDQSAFGKFFKKNTGKSPIDYKKSLN